MDTRMMSISSSKSILEIDDDTLKMTYQSFSSPKNALAFLRKLVLEKLKNFSNIRTRRRSEHG
jgi:hypothetical protein